MRECEACGHELVLHDRVALLAVGQERSRVMLLPAAASTIGDRGTVVRGRLLGEGPAADG